VRLLKTLKRIFRGFRGLLEALVGFCKAYEDFEENSAPESGIQLRNPEFRGLKRASEGFRGLRRL